MTNSPIGNVFHDLCCEGCKHAHYGAPDGQQTYPGCDPVLGQPHASCKYFKALIPAVKERGRIAFYQAPADCPTRLSLAQGRLL